MLRLLGEIKNLLLTNETATKRDLYYRDVTLFRSKQLVVDRSITALANQLQVPRWQLNVLASSKGLIAGDFKFWETRNGPLVECFNSSHGVVIPSEIHEICNLRSNACFVLVVEKDAIFQKLLGDGILQQFSNRCILVTGKGYPDQMTRQLLKRIQIEFEIPIFGLMDADPHGIDILFNYAIGSKVNFQFSNYSHLLLFLTVDWR